MKTPKPGFCRMLRQRLAAMRATTRAFAADRRGVYSTAMVSVLPIIVAMSGTALDLSKAYSVRGDLERAVEAASLAAASLSQQRSPDAVARDYIEKNFSHFKDSDIPLTVDVKWSGSASERTVSVSAKSSVSTIFLAFVGIPSLDFAVSAKAEQSSLGVEISMVLDVSGSMSGQRLRRLQSASEGFIKKMVRDGSTSKVSVNIVPFASSVNLEPIFDSVATPMARATVNPQAYLYYRNMLSQRWRFTSPYIPTNCVEVPLQYFRSLGTPYQALGQMPGTSSGWYNSCPTAANRALVNSNDSRRLVSHVNGLTAGGGTGMDIGAYWGWQFLRPSWRGRIGGDVSNRPTDWSQGALKVLIIMTDGEITGQYRPRLMTYNQITFFPGGRRLYAGGNAYSRPHDQTAVSNFRNVCDRAKSEGVVIYTIGFRVRDGQTSDIILRECASTPSQYFHVESLDIDQAFDSIAANLTALRVSG